MTTRSGLATIAILSLAIFAAPACGQDAGGKVPVPTDRIYTGVMANFGLLDGKASVSPEDLESQIGRHLDIVNVSNNIPERLSGGSLLQGLQKLGANNRYVMLTLHPDYPHLHEILTNQAETEGHKLTPDDFWRKYARDIKAYGRPVFLRWNHEMNGNVYAHCVANFDKCSDPVTGEKQTPEDYVRAWRHVHDIFQQEGATNVSWVWCPGVKPLTSMSVFGEFDSSYSDLASYYPGDNYVDWTCLDGYNNPITTLKWKSFAEVFGPAYRKIMAIAPNKPFMIGEFNSMQKPFDSNARAQWFEDAWFNEIPKEFPNIKAALIWQGTMGHLAVDWKLQDDPAVLDVYKRAMSQKIYGGNGPNRIGSAQ